MTLLGKKEIRDRLGSTVIIEPYKEENLGSAQYDVTLGEHYWRDKGDAVLYNPYDRGTPRFVKGDLCRIVMCETPGGEVNPHGLRSDLKSQILFLYDLTETLPEDGSRHWAGFKSVARRLVGIGDAPVILINPGESLLCHTEEFIGGRGDVTTSMRARSTLGRIGISVCLCAGLGDVGYFNRWTMEVRNHSRFVIPLVPGRRVAQLQFWQIQSLLGMADQYAGSKYQDTDDLAKLKASWSPEDMLPKMWRDREVRR